MLLISTQVRSTRDAGSSHLQADPSLIHLCLHLARMYIIRNHVSLCSSAMGCAAVRSSEAGNAIVSTAGMQCSDDPGGPHFQVCSVYLLASCSAFCNVCTVQNLSRIDADYCGHMFSPWSCPLQVPQLTHCTALHQLSVPAPPPRLTPPSPPLTPRGVHPIPAPSLIAIPGRSPCPHTL